MASGVGLSVSVGVLWGGHLKRAKAAPLVLRPPGAKPEMEFLAECIKCGLCVTDCPYDALMLSVPGDGLQVGTPYFTPRNRPCYMCTDIPCAKACPTGALDLARLVPKDSTKPDINHSRMGLAHIDRETCIAYWGLRCDVCYRACPRIDKALILQASRNDRTGKHAFLAPVVDSDHCTGCGICEHVCITKKASINILPLGVAQGESDARYLRGWKSGDEQLLETSPSDVTTETPRSSSTPADYLNDGI
jgi:ferredoxin-type protein NapG